MGNLTNLQATTPVSEYDATKIATINALVQILDDSIAGSLAISITTADVVLTGTPAAPQAQHLFLNVSGALTGNRAITVPVNATGVGKARLYIVKNGTSGAFTLTFKLAGGTGTTITQGYTAICFFNGTDIVKLWETVSAGSGSAWTAWTPTWTNLSLGNGTVVAAYVQIGKTVFCRLSLVFGSTTSVSGLIEFSFPVTKATYGGTTQTTLGACRCYDASATTPYNGKISYVSSTVAAVVVDAVSGSQITSPESSATVPFTWTTSDEITAEFFYEAV